MARGWGRSEEDLGADKEARRESVPAAGGPRAELQRAAQRRSIELSLANVAQELSKAEHPVRRAMLEAAKRDLEARLRALAE